MQYLDLQQNRRGKPNENFAREIMELFTMGVGNYSEHDIREAARAFTGWNFADLEFVVAIPPGLLSVRGQEIGESRSQVATEVLD